MSTPYLTGKHRLQACFKCARMQGARHPEEQLDAFEAYFRFAGLPGKERTKHDCASLRDAPPVTSLLSQSQFLAHLFYGEKDCFRALEPPSQGVFVLVLELLEKIDQPPLTFRGLDGFPWGHVADG